MDNRLGRRDFLTAIGGAALAAGCRTRADGKLLLRLSHSMNAGRTSLHVLATTFAKLVSDATGGEVDVRLFPSGTLGQEREVVQQLQEGLVDFMCSGAAIWGSVAPRLQVLDFPFLWRSYDHIHTMVDGPVGQDAANYLEGAIRMRPLAWADSFGFRHIVTRNRVVTEPQQLAGLKIRTIQSEIYVKTVEMMGASATPMAFGEVYTSMQTGVIDGYEHDTNTTVHQHFYEVANHMTRTGHIAGVLGLFASTKTLARVPADLRAILERAALEAARQQRLLATSEDQIALDQLRGFGMTIHEIDRAGFLPAAEQLWDREGRALGVMPWLDAIRA